MDTWERQMLLDGRRGFPDSQNSSWVPAGDFVASQTSLHSTSPERSGGSSYAYLPDHQAWVTETKWPQHITRKAALHSISCNNKLGQFPKHSITLQQYQMQVCLQSILFHWDKSHTIKFTLLMCLIQWFFSNSQGCTNITTT